MKNARKAFALLSVAIALSAIPAVAAPPTPTSTPAARPGSGPFGSHGGGTSNSGPFNPGGNGPSGPFTPGTTGPSNPGGGPFTPGAGGAPSGPFTPQPGPGGPQTNGPFNGPQGSGGGLWGGVKRFFGGAMDVMGKVFEFLAVWNWIGDGLSGLSRIFHRGAAEAIPNGGIGTNVARNANTQPPLNGTPGTNSTSVATVPPARNVPQPLPDRTTRRAHVFLTR